MDSGSMSALGVLLFALLCSGGVCALAAALGQVPLETLRERTIRGEAWARWVEWAILDMGRTRTALTGTRTLFSIAAAASLVILLVRTGHSSWAYLLFATAGLLVAFVVIHTAGEVIGRRLGPSLALRMAPALRLLQMLASPALALQSALGPRRSGAETDAYGEMTVDKPLGPPDIRSIVAEAPAPPDEHEMRMIRAILRLEKTTAREIIVPRVDLMAVPLDTSLTEVAQLMMDSGHSRLPVYRESIDNIAGIVYARDLLQFIGQSGVSATLKEMLRPPLFIPESKRLDELLREFQAQRVHMAIVVDEYGGTEGIVTIEDLLEEIVGEIADEFDAAEPQVQVLGPSEVVLDGRASLQTLRELLNADLLSEDVDTVGGYLFSRLGRVPTPGDQLAADGLKFEVLATIGRRVKRVRVIRLPPEAPDNENE